MTGFPRLNPRLFKPPPIGKLLSIRLLFLVTVSCPEIEIGLVTYAPKLEPIIPPLLLVLVAAFH